MYDGCYIKDAHPSYTPPAKRKPVIICGDLNVAANSIDLARPAANEHSSGFTEQERGKFRELLAAGFVDTFRMLYPEKAEYSWWSYRANARARNIGWRLDYFLVSEFAKDKVIDSKIHADVFGSDHCPVELDIDL